MSNRKQDLHDVHQAVREVLWTQWDPIGVNENDQCRDEYDDYVPIAAKLAIRGDDAALALYLVSVRLGSMRLPPSDKYKEVERAVVAQLMRRTREILGG